MNGLFRALAEIKRLANQADVKGKPRVSITFDTVRDREIFKREVKRNLASSELCMTEFYDVSEGTAYGVDFRII